MGWLERFSYSEDFEVLFDVALSPSDMQSLPQAGTGVLEPGFHFLFERPTPLGTDYPSWLTNWLGAGNRLGALNHFDGRWRHGWHPPSQTRPTKPSQRQAEQLMLKRPEEFLFGHREIESMWCLLSHVDLFRSQGNVGVSDCCFHGSPWCTSGWGPRTTAWAELPALFFHGEISCLAGHSWWTGRGYRGVFGGFGNETDW